MGFWLSIFFGFVPMLFFSALVFSLDHYEKEPKVLLGGVFVWGAMVASTGAFILNSLLGVGIFLFTQSEAASALGVGVLIAPFVEESLKAFAVLLVFLVFRSEFDSILDGIIYASITALGFAATENAYYIYQYGYQVDGLKGLLWVAFVRIVLVGWQHPFYTAFTGIGLAITRLSRKVEIKFLAPAFFFLVAIAAHAFHNTLAHLTNGVLGMLFTSVIDWIGWLFMLGFVLVVLYNEGRGIERQLKEEVDLGHISQKQYQTAISIRASIAARLGALLEGRYRVTNRFYQACAELAHKKSQLAMMGEESGNSVAIERLRSDIKRLSPGAAA